MPSSLPGVWRRVLESAARAPSPHNVQPWRFRVVDEARAQLFIETRRTLPNEDVRGSFIILTMGILAETLAIAAAHEGHSIRVEPVTDLAAFSSERIAARGERLLHFADLTLALDAAARPEFPLELLHRRRTSRLHYLDQPVPEEHARALAAMAAAAGHRFVHTHDEARIERILALNVNAVFEDLDHPPYRDEMRSWLRYGETESTAHADGLDARCMNVHPVELWTAFHLSPLLKLPLTRPWFMRRYRAQIGPVATFGFLAGAFWDPHDAYPTGRFLMRFWLEITRLGYCLHPYGNLVTNRPTSARMEALAGTNDVWLAFKIGRSPEPPPSRRLALEDLLVD